MIEWSKLTKEDHQQIDKVVERVNAICREDTGEGIRMLDLKMDLGATHLVYPLRLDEMAETEDKFSLLHDVVGIAAHLNRETGELEHHFVPRFAR